MTNKEKSMKPEENENPSEDLAPKAPPKTETTNIIKTRADKIIDLELNI